MIDAGVRKRGPRPDSAASSCHNLVHPSLSRYQTILGVERATIEISLNAMEVRSTRADHSPELLQARTRLGCATPAHPTKAE